jgi:hypothetical protein
VTLLAVAVATYAGFQAKKLLRIELNRETDREKQAREEQARFVSAWARPNLIEVPKMHFCKPGVEAVIQNYSNQPIFDIRIDWWILGDLEDSATVDQIPPLQDVSRSISSGLIDKFMGEDGYENSYLPTEQVENSCLTLCSFTRISIHFRDSQNRWWTRDTNGILKETIVLEN